MCRERKKKNRSRNSPGRVVLGLMVAVAALDPRTGSQARTRRGRTSSCSDRRARSRARRQPPARGQTEKATKHKGNAQEKAKGAGEEGKEATVASKGPHTQAQSGPARAGGRGAGCAVRVVSEKSEKQGGAVETTRAAPNASPTGPLPAPGPAPRPQPLACAHAPPGGRGAAPAAAPLAFQSKVRGRRSRSPRGSVRAREGAKRTG
jgi:hypothetical protein